MTTNAQCVRSRGPPTWREAERPGRVSYLPPRSMHKLYKSEMKRREAMAREAEDWRRLSIEIARRERSDNAIEYWASVFASLLSRDFGPVPMDGRVKQNNRA